MRIRRVTGPCFRPVMLPGLELAQAASLTGWAALLAAPEAAASFGLGPYPLSSLTTDFADCLVGVRKLEVREARQSTLA